MNIKQNASLRSHNTFGLDVRAGWLTEIHEPEQILDLYQTFPDKRKLILGEGSNVLFLQDFDGLVILNRLGGQIEVLSETPGTVEIAVPGGLHWHDVVTYAVERGWQGIETLALIPGKAGTAPFQNIGAYGTEIAGVITRCHVIDLQEMKPLVLEKEDCGFGYRQSIFKQNEGRYFIHRMDLRLHPGAAPAVRYGALAGELERQGIHEPAVKDVYEAVIRIRRSKLPDPAEVGNAGSFFKNPVISRTPYEQLLERYPDLPSYPAGEGLVKVPAGWLIDRAGWKGFREGDAGVHPKQALVLVNYGHATGFQIYKLAQRIMADIWDRYGIELEPEVRIIS